MINARLNWVRSFELVIFCKFKEMMVVLKNGNN